MNCQQDSVYAWNEDPACQPQMGLVSKNPWKMGVPVKCFYWNNITPFTFFKINNGGIILAESDNAELLGVNKFFRLNTVYLRIFDNERCEIVYDGKTNTIRVTMIR